MPAHIEFRLGSIFDEPCDLLVIPSSAGGTVTPEIQAEIRKAGLPFPSAMYHGVSLAKSQNARWDAVAYAASVTGQTSSPVAVEEIGRELGWLSKSYGFTTISAPLLGAGSGDLAPDVAAGALMRGFMSTAPDGTLLVISGRQREKLAALAQKFPHAVGSHIQPRPELPLVERTALDRLLWSPASRSPADAGSARIGELRAPTAPPPPSAPAAQPSARNGVFISYSHADAEWLQRLQKHLKPLQREGIEVWDDTRLRAGERWRDEIRDALADAKVAILLISADFLASDFIVTDELPPLLKAAEDEGAIILPVILSPCRFARMESLSRFQSVNDPEKPLVQLRHANREKVLDKVARAVEDAFKQ
jgi:nucleotide-binding universal stress UspA family protein